MRGVLEVPYLSRKTKKLEKKICLISAGYTFPRDSQQLRYCNVEFNLGLWKLLLNRDTREQESEIMLFQDTL